MGGATGEPTDGAGSRRRTPTLQDVAAAAGGSRSTASRAINGEAKVSSQARAAVEEAVHRLGFTPNPAARTLVTHRTNAVALVVPEPDERIVADPFFAAAVQGLSLALADTDLQLVLLMASMGDSPDRTVRYLRHGHVDGAVVVSHHQAGWRAGLAGAGLPADAVEHGDFTTAGGAGAMQRLLSAHPDLDAVFVASDLMAAGALAVLRAGNRSVPGDIAVVGYDDSAVAAVTDPPSPTVVNPVAALARTAGTILLSRLDGTEPTGGPVIFPPELVVRASA